MSVDEIAKYLGVPICFNSSVLDSEPWAYLFLFKFFPTPFTGSRQRVYPSGRLTTRKLSDDLAITMFEKL
jgi:hypothetical protein